MTRKDEYSDDELERAREMRETELGRPMTVQEQKISFGRVLPDSRPTDTSSRTIWTGELDPSDGQSRRHRSPGFIARLLGFGKKG